MRRRRTHTPPPRRRRRRLLGDLRLRFLGDGDGSVGRRVGSAVERIAKHRVVGRSVEIHARGRGGSVVVVAEEG